MAVGSAIDLEPAAAITEAEIEGDGAGPPAVAAAASAARPDRCAGLLVLSGAKRKGKERVEATCLIYQIKAKVGSRGVSLTAC